MKYLVRVTKRLDNNYLLHYLLNHLLPFFINNRFLPSDLFVAQLTCTPGRKEVNYAPNPNFKGISGNFRIFGEIRVGADAGNNLEKEDETMSHRRRGRDRETQTRKSIIVTRR